MIVFYAWAVGVAGGSGVFLVTLLLFGCDVPGWLT